MLILGDVMATVAIVVFSALSLWASGVLVAIVFQERTALSARAFQHSFWKTFFLGLGVGLVLTFFAAVFYGNPATRLFSLLIFAFMIAVALFGSGGLTKLLANKVQSAGGAKSEYDALAKGGLLFVLFALLPFFGWFIVMPVMLITSIGAGFKALFRMERKVVAPEVV